MPLTQRDIEELKRIHKRRFGQVLSDDEAFEMGNRLLRLMDVLTRTDETRADPLRSSNPVQFDRFPPSS